MTVYDRIRDCISELAGARESGHADDKVKEAHDMFMVRFAEILEGYQAGKVKLVIGDVSWAKGQPPGTFDLVLRFAETRP